MRIVRDVEYDLRPPRQHLEASRHFRLQETAAHILRRHRQTLAQAVERGDARGGIAQLERAAQRRMRQAVTLAARSPVTPLLRRGNIAKVAVDHRQLGADRPAHA